MMTSVLSPDQHNKSPPQCQYFRRRRVCVGHDIVWGVRQYVDVEEPVFFYKHMLLRHCNRPGGQAEWSCNCRCSAAAVAVAVHRPAGVRSQPRGTLPICAVKIARRLRLSTRAVLRTLHVPQQFCCGIKPSSPQLSWPGGTQRFASVSFPAISLALCIIAHGAWRRVVSIS